MSDAITLNPFQYQNPHRGGSSTWQVPEDDFAEDRCREVVVGVKTYIVEALGYAGLRALTSVCPDFFDRIYDSVMESYLQGHYTGWGDRLSLDARLSSQATANLVSTLLEGTIGLTPSVEST